MLRSLGHEVTEASPSYGRMYTDFYPLYFRGIRDEALTLPHPERLSDQTALAARGAGLVLLALATVSALPNDVLTAGVLGVVTLAAGLLVQRTDLCGDVAAAVRPLGDFSALPG